jgi:hypothetical protein
MVVDGVHGMIAICTEFIHVLCCGLYALVALKVQTIISRRYDCQWSALERDVQGAAKGGA